MKPLSKSLFVAFWLLTLELLDRLGHFFAIISGLADWSQLGWAFGGSTAFVVYEAIQGVAHRKAWQRLLLIGLCMFLSMAFSAEVASRLRISQHSATVALALFGYPLLGKAFKKVDSVESIDDLTDLTKTNKKP